MKPPETYGGPNGGLLALPDDQRGIVYENARLIRENGCLHRHTEQAELVCQQLLNERDDLLDQVDGLKQQTRTDAPAGLREEAQPTEARSALPQRAYDLLPEVLRRAASFFNTWYRRDVYLTALLGALSSALPKMRFRYGQQYFSSHLYIFILARAASGKGVMPVAFRWLSGIDDLLLREGAEEREAWQQRKQAYELAKGKNKAGPLAPDPPGPEPPERCLKAGANTTAAALGHRLANNPSVFIGSTEADALSSSNKREHGDFSHLMRKAFHHEEAQIDRKSDATLRIREPRLALVLSGTPKQFPRFMEGGIEDGLFSRFAVYSFEAPPVFEAQWATDADEALETFTQEASRRTLDLFALLRARETPLYFDVPDHLKPHIEKRFRELHDALAAQSAFDLLPTIKRGVVITLRIAAVLCVWRHFEQHKPLGQTNNVMASEADVEAALGLALAYVEHALREALRMDAGLGQMPDTERLGGNTRMTGEQRAFFDALPEAFVTKEALRLAEDRALPRSTLFDWLGKWVEARLLDKPDRGKYKKLRPTNNIGLLDSLDFDPTEPPNGDPVLDVALDVDAAGLDNGRMAAKVQDEVQGKVQSSNGPNGTKTAVHGAIVQKSKTSNTIFQAGQRVTTPRGPGTVEHDPGERRVKVRVDALANKRMPVRAFDRSDLAPAE